MPHSVQVTLFEDHKSLAKFATNLILRTATESVSQRGQFSLVLSGGGTPRPIYELLASTAYIDKFPWGETLIFWGDERCVPPDHEESNYGQAWTILLRRTTVKEKNVHRIKGEFSPASAAKDYAKQLQKVRNGQLHRPRFDLVLLGLGDDGHTASLFPGEVTEEERQATVMAVTAHYGDRPATRVTLTPVVFNSARHIIFLVVGASKAKAVAASLEGAIEPERWPVQRIRPSDGSITWLLDVAAANDLSQPKANL